MNKQTYLEAPSAELITVRFEENIMSPDGSWDNSIQQGSSWADDPDGGYGLE